MSLVNPPREEILPALGDAEEAFLLVRQSPLLFFVLMAVVSTLSSLSLASLPFHPNIIKSASVCELASVMSSQHIACNDPSSSCAIMCFIQRRLVCASISIGFPLGVFAKATRKRSSAYLSDSLESSRLSKACANFFSKAIVCARISRNIVSFNCFTSFCAFSKASLSKSRLFFRSDEISCHLNLACANSLDIFAFKICMRFCSLLVAAKLLANAIFSSPSRSDCVFAKSRMATNLRFCKRISSNLRSFASIMSRYRSNIASTSSPRSLHCA